MSNEQTTQAAQPAPRTIAGRYALLAELGRGGMGVVWRAEDRVIGRQVAIKELRLPDGAEETVHSERVLREVRTGGRLNDPAVVTVFDVVSEQGGTYIVMELVEAPTLSELVRRHGPLPAAQAASIGRQVLTALQAAHEAGIVHRDVKPGNIMVAPNGRVKLTDFGIAQAVDDPRLTTSGMIIGSPAFMAPERVAGNEAVPASDLWSLGATLFFAVEGAMAFERPTTAATLHAIMTEVPYLSRTQGPLASAIMGLLIASPDARIAAAQAHHLLAMAANAQPTPSGGHTAVWSGPSPTRVANGAPAQRSRKPLWIGAAVAAVVLLAGGFVLGDRWAAPGRDAALLPTLTYGLGGNVPGFDIGSYACTSAPVRDQQSLGENDWVDCKNLHYAELYDTATTYGSSGSGAVKAAYPSQLAAWAEARCAMTFHSNAVPEQAGMGRAYRALVPSPQAWETPPESQYSDYPVRKVYCLLANADGSASTGTAATGLK
ncbi:serine/threonine protein kinase [Amycolatopsis acidiphila]|uniref:non-specific serine/threonine protein kinase n=1 Tax=Amycolatopsis acidiphila TaxID=715473 RepID=A0A557ZN61_9PSEU|nr:serine/threonine-protein kinase [Amycolatopsis acidiphila]TVT13443.1 serine/threonine protein kinase [Amycolatopsis acidiphila]UIJ62116.1 serine/threonine protein kinase [Amycolatopsis acidiphila]GHG91945.1 serine/threonine protein kinase [Amycolatopsis acidiphila]